MAETQATATIMDQVEKVLRRQAKHDLESSADAFVLPRSGNSKWKPVGLDFQAEKTRLIFNQVGRRRGLLSKAMKVTAQPNFSLP